eukprot:15462216-Alexandrium_andersonii.AAC.1
MIDEPVGVGVAKSRIQPISILAHQRDIPLGHSGPDSRHHARVMPEDDTHDSSLVGNIAERAFRALQTKRVAVRSDTRP